MSTSERNALAAFRGLLEATSVHEAMAHVAAIARGTADADLAAVFLRVGGEARLCLVAGDGCPAGLLGTLELAPGIGTPAAWQSSGGRPCSPPRSRRFGLGRRIPPSRLPPSPRGSRPPCPTPESRSALCW